ncbi:MAG TPA: hypothetical protein VK697_11650 [Methylomirabilota bacterium]|jgi:hypothetical protein|nr:hypothetical protein [Methylomirabilota bacterium]
MRAFPALILAAVLVAACLPSATSAPPATSPAPTPGDSVAATDSPASVEPTAPPASAEPTPSTAVIDSPPPVEPSASASAGPGPAGACSGSDENRDFFRAAASALSWTVYCAVVPAGWFVDSGQYRQASGGWVQIAYRGPGGARLELHEGAFCTASDGCVPSGTESGDAPFGDKMGTFVALDDGGFAVVVDRGEKISWLAVGTGLDEAAFRAIAGALTVVGG